MDNYRPYTLQEAYDAFGYRTYTNVIDTRNGEKYIIYGMHIYSGEVLCRICVNMQDSKPREVVNLKDLLKYYTWSDGAKLGVNLDMEYIPWT